MYQQQPVILYIYICVCLCGCMLACMRGQIYLEVSEPLTCTEPFQGPGRVHSSGLEMPWNLTTRIWKKLVTRFSHIGQQFKKINMTLPITSFETEGNFSKLSVIENKFWSTMLEKRMDYPSVLSVKRSIIEGCQALN